MTSEESNFLRAIILSPEPRAVAAQYADWLEEQWRVDAAADYRQTTHPRSDALRDLIPSSYEPMKHWGYLVADKRLAHRWHYTLGQAARGVAASLVDCLGAGSAQAERLELGGDWGVHIHGLWIMYATTNANAVKEAL